MAEKCKLCEKIGIKLQRRQDEMERITRWREEGADRDASIDMALETIGYLDQEVQALQNERTKRLQNAVALTRDLSSDSDDESESESESDTDDATETEPAFEHEKVHITISRAEHWPAFITHNAHHTISRDVG